MELRRQRDQPALGNRLRAPLGSPPSRIRLIRGSSIWAGHFGRLGVRVVEADDHADRDHHRRPSGRQTAPPQTALQDAATHRVNHVSGGRANCQTSYRRASHTCGFSPHSRTARAQRRSVPLRPRPGIVTRARHAGPGSVPSSSHFARPRRPCGRHHPTAVMRSCPPTSRGGSSSSPHRGPAPRRDSDDVVPMVDHRRHRDANRATLGRNRTDSPCTGP